jgi:CBS domain-containing protein
MRVRDGMSNVVLTVGPSHSLSAAARLMTDRNVGAAVVVDPEGAGFGIVTERDILRSVAAGEDSSAEPVGNHLTEELITAAPDWSLEQAAEAMLEGGFRHLLVVNGGELEGILSMRDIVRCWSRDHVAS